MAQATRIERKLPYQGTWSFRPWRCPLRGTATPLHRYRWLIGAVIVVYKPVDEYITQIGNIDRSELIQRLLGG